MRHPIFSWPFSCRIAMEPVRVRSSLWGNRVRRIRVCNGHRARAATANKCFNATRENIFAGLSHLCARAKLDLFAPALAQLLKGACCSRGRRPRLRKSRRIPPRSPPAATTAKTVSIRVHLWLIWRHANFGDRRCWLYRLALG